MLESKIRKPFRIFVKQEMMGISGISWTICKSFTSLCSQILTTPACTASLKFYRPVAQRRLVSKYDTQQKFINKISLKCFQTSNILSDMSNIMSSDMLYICPRYESTIKDRPTTVNTRMQKCLNMLPCKKSLQLLFIYLLLFIFIYYYILFIIILVPSVL